jgi:hypothetical protein
MKPLIEIYMGVINNWARQKKKSVFGLLEAGREKTEVEDKKIFF